MNCEEWRERLKGWLESRWDARSEATEVPELLKGHAAECSDCAARLEAALLLSEGTGLRKAPPADLADRIGARLNQEGALRVKTWPRWVALPLAAALVVAVTFFVTQRYFRASPSDTVIVRLILEIPEARDVTVVGDWNGWNPTAHRLSDRDGDGIWEIELTLKRGEEYQYQFLIDGERWIPDPNSPFQVDDGFGGHNSILQI